MYNIAFKIEIMVFILLRQNLNFWSMLLQVSTKSDTLIRSDTPDTAEGVLS